LAGNYGIRIGMAVKRKSIRAREPESISSPIVSEPVVEEKSGWKKFGPVMVIIMMIMSFALGALWNKSQMLSTGTGSGNGSGAAAAKAPAGKYASFKAATDDYAKQIKLDVKKFDSCVQSGSKATEVGAEETEGQALGVSGTPGFFVNGRFVGGAFPYEAFKELIDMELNGRGSSDITAYSQTLQTAASQEAFNPVPKAVSVGNAPTKGPQNAKVVIIEYSDAQCPYCERSYQTFKQIFANYGDKILFAYKQYPLVQIHPNAQKAAEVLLCAKDQGKFWEMHNMLFDKQTEWSGLSSGWN
jgi:protein-disulfide isomerase